MPSRSACRSHSKPAPRAVAARKAAIVFSGAMWEAPRWPTKRMALSSGERMVVDQCCGLYEICMFCVGGCRPTQRMRHSSESA